MADRKTVRRLSAFCQQKECWVSLISACAATISQKEAAFLQLDLLAGDVAPQPKPRVRRVGALEGGSHELHIITYIYIYM